MPKGPPYVTLTTIEVARAAHAVGFRGDALRIAIAVARAESNFRRNVVSPTNDYGLWQINKPAHPKYDFNRLLDDANYNAGAAWDISGRGKSWTPWYTYRDGKHLPFMAEAESAAVEMEAGTYVGSGGISPQDLVAAAQRYIGTNESPTGSNKQIFAAKAGHQNGLPWCATFIVACAREIGLKLPSESASTKTMAQGFKDAGAWHAKGAPGDIAFFDFPDSSTGIQHVGIITGGSGSSYQTIEGNTSSGAGGSQDNGGTVAAKTRDVGTIVGFGRPAYGAGMTLGGGGLLPVRFITAAGQTAAEAQVNAVPAADQAPFEPEHHHLPAWLEKKGLYGKSRFRGRIKRLIDPEKYSLDFLYNPSDIEFHYAADDSIFVPEAQEKWVEDTLTLTSANTAIGFTLLFDRTYEVMKGSTVGVLTDILALERICGIIPSAPSLKMYPVTLFLGSPEDFVFDAVITEVQVKYTHFSLHMIPMRAGVTVMAKRRSRSDKRLWKDGNVPEQFLRPADKPKEKEDSHTAWADAVKNSEANKSGESVSQWAGGA